MRGGQVVVFELAGNRYGIEISSVHEILRVTEITPMPEMPAHFEGAINLRGAVVPVLNLRSRLGLEKAPVDQHTRIILVSSADKVFGLIVDRVLEVNTYSDEEMEAVDTLGGGNGVVRGIVKKEQSLWLVLNLEHIA